MTQNEKIMQECLKLARQAEKRGEVPVGCVIVKDGQIIVRTRNSKENDLDATAHAEMRAIRKACKVLKTKNLSGCELFVTKEPCAMCAGAVMNARISKVVFGAFDKRFGCCGSVMNVAHSPNLNHRAEIEGGVLESECSQLLSDFFARLRELKGNHGDKKNKCK